MSGPLSHERAAGLEASGIWARWLGEGEALDLIRDRLRTHTSWRAFVATGHQDADIPTDGTSRGGSTVDGAWPPARLARLRLRVRAILHDPSLQTPGFEPRGEDVYHTAEDDEEDWERARASGALDALLGRETTATAATGPPRAMGEPSGPTHPPPGHHDARQEGPPGHASPPPVPSLDGCVHGVSKESPESARDPASSRASPGGTEGADSGGGGSGGGETSPPGHEQGKKQVGEDIDETMEGFVAASPARAEAFVLGSNPTEAAVAAFRRHRTNTCESNKDGWTDPTDAEWRERTLVTRLRVAAARRDRGGDQGRVKPPPARTPEGMRDYVAASSTPGFCPERWDVSSVVPALPGGWDEFAGHAAGDVGADGGADGGADANTAVRQRGAFTPREKEEAETRKVEAELRAELTKAADLRLELDDLRGERLGLEAESNDLDARESAYWDDFNDFKLALERHVDERDSLVVSVEQTGRQLERLRRTNVFNDAFHVWFDGPFGTVNGFRLGRLPNVAVEWDEINAAWGMTCLLLSTMANAVKLEFTQYTLQPMGSFSKVLDKKGNAYELYGPVNILSSHKYDRAMAGFLHCLHEFGTFANESDVAAGVNPPFELPYAIDGDKIDGRKIAFPFNRYERWTAALKIMLTDLKTCLAWLSNQQGSTRG